jgi:hypothetical protein
MANGQQCVWELAAASLMVATLSGCGSEQATADNGGVAGSPPVVAVATEVTEQAKRAESKPAAALAANSSEKSPPPRIVEKSFDDIKFDIEPGAPFRREMLRSEIESLAGKRVRIRGYILPTPQKRGIKQFVLVRDNQECCFGPGAALYDCILVEMQPGRTAEFSIRPVAVDGTFGIDLVMGLDDKPLAIYRLDGEAVH